MNNETTDIIRATPKLLQLNEDATIIVRATPKPLQFDVTERTTTENATHNVLATSKPLQSDVTEWITTGNATHNIFSLSSLPQEQVKAIVELQLASDTRIAERYRILRTIGVGTFGYVYLCEQLRTGQLFAMKEAFPCRGSSRGTLNEVIAADAEEMELCKQTLLREMITLASIKHRNVVQLEDAVSANNTLYLVMEFIEGESVFSLIDRQRGVSLESAQSIAHSIFDGLSYLHERDVIHGDVKPNNIVLRTSMEPVLLDFGSASRISDPKYYPMSFTPGYSCPEKLTDEKPLSPATDIYSICTTLLALSTGVHGSKIASSAEWRNIGFPRMQNSQAVRRWRHGLLAGVIETQSERPQSIAELRDILDMRAFVDPKSPINARHSIFVSYSRHDTDRVEQFVRELQLSGVGVWIDRSGITPGENWGGEIVRAVRDSVLCLVFCTKNSMQSQNVAREVLLADTEKKSLVAVKLEDFSMSDDIALFLTAGQHIDCRDGDISKAVLEIKDFLLRRPRA